MRLRSKQTNKQTSRAAMFVGQALRLPLVWLGNRCGCPTIAAASQQRHEWHRTQNRNLQAVWGSIRVDEENSFSAVRRKEMVFNWLCRMAGEPGWRWRFQLSVQ